MTEPQQGGVTVLEPRELPAPEDGEVFHYVDKSKITESAVMGTIVTALCGAQFPVTKSPKPGSPVCRPCQEMLDVLKAFGPSGGSPAS